MSTATLTTPRRHTHWANLKEKRLFLVVDIPEDGIGSVVILEIKDWPEDEKREFQFINPVDWIILTQDKKLLTPYLPTL